MFNNEGIGTKNEHEWADSRPENETQPPQHTYSPEDTETTAATDAEHATHSYGTLDSQDPTHETYTQALEDPMPRGETSPIATKTYTPPQFERHGTTADTMRPSLGTTIAYRKHKK